MGNIGSIVNMLKKLGKECLVTNKPQDIINAKKLILPGVGAFDNGMKRLDDLGLIEPMNQKVLLEQTPVLGICLGMQLLTNGSEEGFLSGLGWIDASTVKFKFNEAFNKLRIPHMGWNTISLQNNSALYKNMHEEPRFYFVHSFHVVCSNQKDVIATADYGFPVVASLEKNNIYGAQFHPEKSHKFGMKLLENFSNI